MITLFVLQILDIITTMMFMSMGVSEANPYIVMMMQTFGTFPGLCIAKLPVVLLVAICKLYNYERPIEWANVFYMGLILWNILAVCLA